MESLFKWFYENREWIFSGAGVAAIVAIVGFLLRKKSDDRHEVQQINITAKGDVVGRDKITK